MPRSADTGATELTDDLDKVDELTEDSATGEAESSAAPENGLNDPGEAGTVVAPPPEALAEDGRTGAAGAGTARAEDGPAGDGEAGAVVVTPVEVLAEDAGPPSADEVGEPPANAAGSRSAGGGSSAGLAKRHRVPRRWLVVSYLLLAVVVVGTLFAGTRDDGGPRTNEDRAAALSETIKCPTCRSQSVATSDAPASKAIRAEIVRQIGAGRTDAEIRGFLVQSYGQDILLTPSSKGLTGLVWILPVVAFMAAVGGVVLVFRRWKQWA